MEANEYILQAAKKRKEESKNKDDHNQTSPSTGEGNVDSSSTEPVGNQGWVMLDAACAPSNIWYPQDSSLLNEAREKLETIITRFCKAYGLPLPSI